MGLSRESIAEAALAILDETGEENALTMRALAQRLGVQAPSLYAHISGLDDLLDLIHRRINETIDVDVLVASNDESDFRTFVHRYRDAYRIHPVAATMIASRAINRDHALRVYEPIAAYLLARKVPSTLVMPVMAMLDNLIMGSAVEPFAAGFIGPSRDYLPQHPALAEALRTTNRRAIDDVGFEVGLDAACRLIDDLAEG
jgi:AcrR family transcriptional regulator